MGEHHYEHRLRRRAINLRKRLEAMEKRRNGDDLAKFELVKTENEDGTLTIDFVHQLPGNGQ